MLLELGIVSCAWSVQRGSSRYPSLVIFAAPKPGSIFPGSTSHRALQSWLRLRPPVDVILFGAKDDRTRADVIKDCNGRVQLEPEFDRNFMGVPLFNSLIARAMQDTSDISRFVNADIILINDVWSAIDRARRDVPHWLVAGMRIDVNNLPGDVSVSLANPLRADAEVDVRIRDYVRKYGNLHSYGGVDFWAWDNSGRELIDGIIPSFVYGRGKYDNWFTHGIISAGKRRAIDATGVTTRKHLVHAHNHAVGQTSAISGKILWSAAKRSSFELLSNIHLANAFDNGYRYQMGTAYHIPLQVVSCNEPSLQNVCMLERVRPATCSCESSPFYASTMADPVDLNGTYQCGSVSVETIDDFKIPTHVSEASEKGLPHTLDQLLPHVADEYGLVVLTASTFPYHTLLMNLVCILRTLSVNNLLIAAFDDDTYRFAFVRGLAVFQAVPDMTVNTSSPETTECAYGSICFRRVTKRKSRTVLNILKKGYHVLWTDVDVVWMKNPIAELINSYGAGVLAVQGNAPTRSEPANGSLRINSGFYLARSDNKTIDAFESITRHANVSNKSEQPSFYVVLCGAKGEFRVGDTACVEPATGLRTEFLPMRQYANGAFLNSTNVADTNLVILHNNWVKGLERKVARLRKRRLWFIADADEMSCRYSWSTNLLHV